MKYRNRYLEAKIKQYQVVFPVILVTGARQVGKSTLLRHCLGENIQSVVFDPVVDVGNAREDPEFFLDQYPPPIIFDEIQYAPELLPVIKRRVDLDSKPGQYFLTGSQSLSLIKNISESLAGRVVVLDLATMSLSERIGYIPTQSSWLSFVLEAKEKPPDLSTCLRHKRNGVYDTIFSILWRGGYPGTLDFTNDIFPDFFKSYIQTYVERDIRVLVDLLDQHNFSRFLGLCAALTAQEVNFSQLGRDIGITPQTANRWLAVLKATYQWFEIPTYSGNAVKRLSCKPKGYLTDTGLAAYLQRISSPEALSGHPLLGAFFETHVVLDIHRQFSHLTTPPGCYHWRTYAGAEVDLILERDGIFWPIEIKCKSKITKADARGIYAFRETYPHLTIGPGLIIAAVNQIASLPNNILVLPYDLI